jgi:hypothetical protein
MPGIDGKDGLPGRPGTDGKDGLPGQAGKDGKDGLQGLAGQDGKDGAAGPAGPSGDVPALQVWIMWLLVGEIVIAVVVCYLCRQAVKKK